MTIKPVRKSERFIGHPSYNGNLIIKDYGVVELNGSITMDSFTAPIPVSNLKKFLFRVFIKNFYLDQNDGS